NDPGTNQLYLRVMDTLVTKAAANLKSSFAVTREMSEKVFVIPPARTRYLSEISENNRNYDKWVNEQAEIAQQLYAVRHTIQTLAQSNADDAIIKALEEQYNQLKIRIDQRNMMLLEQWPEKIKRYRDPVFKFKVRDREIGIKTHTESLSHVEIPKVSLPRYQAWGELLRWSLQENVPGEFPYTAAIYAFKGEGEDPTRMFAVEG